LRPFDAPADRSLPLLLMTIPHGAPGTTTPTGGAID
jgi:hypothetical protein